MPINISQFNYSNILCSLVLVISFQVPMRAVALLSSNPLSTDLYRAHVMPLFFEPNVGQENMKVKFVAHTLNVSLYFAKEDIFIQTGKKQKLQEKTEHQNLGLTGDQTSDTSISQLHFLDANPTSFMAAGHLLDSEVNYMIGSDPARWKTNVPTYSSIDYRNLYPGVDLQYEEGAGKVKGTYSVAAGADPKTIRWIYNNTGTISIDDQGNLHIPISGSPSTEIVEQAPIAWQKIDGKHVPVDVRYALGPDCSIGFAFGSYDKSFALIIDPTLDFSTYFGGSAYDEGQGIAVDQAGYVYVTGITQSVDFPLGNAYQPKLNGKRDIFVSKLSPDGSKVIYSTYIGGSDMDGVNGFPVGIAVDAQHDVFVTGTTSSSDFPLVRPLQSFFGGVTDAFILALNTSGSALLFSTYLGGSNQDFAYDLKIDSQGDMIIVGSTNSPDFPIRNAIQPLISGGSDAFLAKLNIAQATLSYSTYWGGSNDETAYGAALDNSGNAYIVGQTTSSNFPLHRAYQQQNNGGADAFISKLNEDGSSVAYSTYIGGAADDVGFGVAVDDQGNAYITGSTISNNFPIVNAFQPIYGGVQDAFVAKVTPSGSALLYSTYLGGSGYEKGYRIGVDGANFAYVTGLTLSSDFPQLDPISEPSDGGNAFVTKVTPSGSALLYSTLLGGNTGTESGLGIALDSSGGAFVTGYTTSTDFPTVSAYQPAEAGGIDSFISRIASSYTTPTPCTIEFSDVPAGSTFYSYVRCLACQGVINGYETGCETGNPCYRPNSNVTRGQIAKIVSAAAGFSEPQPNQLFQDVPVGSTFQVYVGRLSSRGYLQGYSCGGVGEPCGVGSLPYFRTNNNATRGQISKIVANAAGLSDSSDVQMFEDVAPGSTYYDFIERLAALGVMFGYACGGVGEPCGPGNMPYFRPSNNVTRGQASKIVSNTFFPSCQAMRTTD